MPDRETMIAEVGIWEDGCNGEVATTDGGSGLRMHG